MCECVLSAPYFFFCTCCLALRLTLCSRCDSISGQSKGFAFSTHSCDRPVLAPTPPTHHHVFGPPTRHPSRISELQRERPTLNQICYFNPSASRLLSTQQGFARSRLVRRRRRSSFRNPPLLSHVFHSTRCLLFFFSHTATTAKILSFVFKNHCFYFNIQNKTK